MNDTSSKPPTKEEMIETAKLRSTTLQAVLEQKLGPFLQELHMETGVAPLGAIMLVQWGSTDVSVGLAMPTSKLTARQLIDMASLWGSKLGKAILQMKVMANSRLIRERDQKKKD